MTGADDDPKAFVRRYLQEVFSEGKLEALDEFTSGDSFQGGVTELATRWRRAFPDLHIEVEGVIVEDNRVVTEETLTGTHDGVYETPWVGSIPPTGRSASPTALSDPGCG